MPRIVADHVNAAKMAKEAGFDGVELHCSNGYLMDCFLQSMYVLELLLYSVCVLLVLRFTFFPLAVYVGYDAVIDMLMVCSVIRWS